MGRGRGDGAHLNLRGSPAAAVLAASWLLSGAAPGLEGDPGASVETLGDRAARILTQAIRLESVNPPGDERPIAEYFVRLLREGGLEAALVETPPGNSQVGRAAAWGRLPGTGERRPLVLLSHLDVVPADADAWQTDPFAGIRRGDRVIGRGALDAKGIAVVHLLAVSELARRGTTLKRDLLFLSTPDEETGGIDGAGYLVRERTDLLLDAEYVLTEGGGVRTGAQGGPPVWGVSIIEKSPCWMRMIARGTPGHSSAPTRDAAVPRLIASLDRVRRLEHPIRVVPEVQRMFAALAPIALPQDAHGYTDLATSLVADPAFRSRFMAERANAALVRNTLSITVLEGATSTNVLPREASAHLDGRLLPFERCDAFVDRVRQSTADSRITVETLLSFRSRSSSIDTPLYRAIRNIASVTDPGAIVVPRMLAGFTDAHYFRDLGITAYGFVPRWHRGGEVRGIHGPDEHISLENLERGVNTLVAILEELDRID
jgi:acetylornithine deacetylase/succinyl-diaminopimelate desuccinylase-like protein